jgi:hypothetical protein
MNKFKHILNKVLMFLFLGLFLVSLCVFEAHVWNIARWKIIVYEWKSYLRIVLFFFAFLYFFLKENKK